MTAVVLPLYALGELNDPGPRSLGLGGAGVALGNDAWAGLRNPADINSAASYWGGGWSQQFGLPELSLEQASGTTRYREWRLSGGLRSFGGEEYRESTVAMGLARRIHKQFVAGARVDYLRADNSIQNGQVLALNLGWSLSLTSGLTLAGVWEHAGNPRVSGLQDRLAERVVAGVGYELPAQGRALLDIVQEERFPLEVRTGIEIDAKSGIALRLGMRTNPVRPSGGLGISVRNWRFHYGFDVHPDLGTSHGVGLEFVKKSRRSDS